MTLKKLTLLIVIATALFSCEKESYNDEVLVEVENPTVEETTEDEVTPNVDTITIVQPNS